MAFLYHSKTKAKATVLTINRDTGNARSQAASHVGSRASIIISMFLPCWVQGKYQCTALCRRPILVCHSYASLQQHHQNLISKQQKALIVPS